uniref:Beta-catenin-like protein 1 n=1 Tax=Timema genevievae TaxID=629358 RepID=A0A7R9PIV3_TIMGE|nr:unnamed protein product [Timema genevievae]
MNVSVRPRHELGTQQDVENFPPLRDLCLESARCSVRDCRYIERDSERGRECVMPGRERKIKKGFGQTGERASERASDWMARLASEHVNPPNTPKRTQDDELEEEDDNEFERQRKIRKLAKSRKEKESTSKLKPPPEPSDEQELDRAITDEEREKILKFGEILDDSTLKRMILLFEKRALKNQEMRIKFPDIPEKPSPLLRRFMESEVELHETIQELHAVATVPDLYPIMVELQAVPSMLELLAHENTDVAVAVVDLLQELTDVDILNESEEGADVLIETLLDQQICALLVQNLERMDESVKEEVEGVHNTLAIFENLIEFRPEVCSDAAKQGLLQWLLRRLRVKMPFDGNKLYASEILSILLQNSPENRQLLGDLEGIDVLLQQLAFYKRHDPSSNEENEMMENLFNCLCSSLMHAPNRERFLRGEGLQLMNLMLREKKLSRNGSLKVLDHAMSGPDGKENCNKFVDILGLRTIFPLFMKTPKRNRKRILTTEEHEGNIGFVRSQSCHSDSRFSWLCTQNEHVVSIISSMLRNCRGPQQYAGNLGDAGDTEWRDLEQQHILQLVDKF